MQFSIIAAAVMATLVAADYTSTTSTTAVVTITSCGPEVTNCPGKTYTSTVTSASGSPIKYGNSTVTVTSSTTPVVVVPTSSPVTLATTYITTCIPTVITSVYTVTPTPKVTPVASATGVISYSKNVTSPSATATPSQYLSGASTVQGSVVVAAVAGFAAFFL